MKLIIALFALLAPTASFAKNLHLIDSSPNGFAIYRYGQPNTDEMLYMRNTLDIHEVMILSGDGEKRGNEKDLGFKIFYNQKQSDDIPLTSSFLDKFDTWVLESRSQGKKIAFRCECGCHRTGRLAAYYQMKYMRLQPEDAIAIMDEYGSLMFLHRQLYPQVRALHQYISGKPCSEKKEHCVKME